MTSTMTSMPTASDGVPDAAGPAAPHRVVDAGTGRVDRRERPVRLVAWEPTGSTDDEVLTVGHGLDVAAWVGRGRAEHPERMVAVVYDDDDPLDATGAAPSAALSWRDRLRIVEDCLRGTTSRPADGAAVQRWSGDAAAASLAVLRRWVSEVLREPTRPAQGGVGGPGSTDARRTAVTDAVLLVDELASNVVEHASGRLTVELAVSPERVLVVVPDPRPMHLPMLGHPPALQPSGRGLLVVDAVSIRWGIVIGLASKAVWAEVARPV